MSDPFVVIGGDAAGLSAASKCKRTDPDRDVLVFEKGRWVSYAHCGMPYYVKGEVDDLLSLTTLSPDEVTERGIDLRREHEVTAIDTARRTVTVDPVDGEPFEQSYGDLLVATGARAIAPIDGVDRDGVFTLHHMDSAAALRAFLEPPGAIDPETVGNGYTDTAYVQAYAEREQPATAAVVGGGYVGIETCEALAAWGLDVHLFQRGPAVLPPFGEAVSEAVATELREQGVQLHLDCEVRALVGDEGDDSALTSVAHTDGETPVDLAVVGVGVQPNAEIAADAGIETAAAGAVAVDDYGRTSVPDVYAAGDCAVAEHVVTGERTWVPLGLTANRAGRAVGATVGGDPTPTGGVAGTAAVKAFEVECGRTGLLDHEAAREAGFDPVSETVTANSRSGYYPGAADTTVTLCADRVSGRLLGGSVVGADRAAVRIDTVATALEGGLTVAELERTDLAYAPPFSPVWDPVLVAAKVLAGEVA
ncbi:FAD-dependent oxidoreductase [Halobaculum sp. MBLA0147]|uniref:FAD-dependent oxidoreductase n=1 Tax=Halobaculum sp. MBLA0147 TaxID=3079934 RepID=UPI0035269219